MDICWVDDMAYSHHSMGGRKVDFVTYCKQIFLVGPFFSSLHYYYSHIIRWALTHKSIVDLVYGQRDDTNRNVVGPLDSNHFQHRTSNEIMELNRQKNPEKCIM